MSVPIVDYAMGELEVSNPDGSLPAIVHECVVVPGPGATLLGKYDRALSFGTAGLMQTALPTSALNFKKFCVRAAVKVDKPVVARQNLVEAKVLPFALFLDKAVGSGDFSVAVSVAPAAHGWSGTNTEFVSDLKIDQWYVFDLIYDTDTVAVAIDGIVLSVHAFPSGRLNEGSEGTLYVGTWVDGLRNHFEGCMAALQLLDDIPLELENQLDARRSSPEWFISFKLEQLRPTLNFGKPRTRPTYDATANAYVQSFDSGLIMFNDSIGVAFEMHGTILKHYVEIASKSSLGDLVSDEGPAGKPGSRKNVFRSGAIYWSASTGPVVVVGQIYLDYEMMGEAAFLGLPLAAQASISSGKEQIFQGGRMYHKIGTPRAHEVHGSILAKFIATGGVSRWGYPVGNECDVKKGSSRLGRHSDFEACTFYWSTSTGAFEVHGSIRERYLNLNGPLGALGFPTSNEENIPGASAPARYNTFQRGSILWFGTPESILVCHSFKIFLGRIDTQESEPFGGGQNDVYINASVSDNGHEILRTRFPGSGDFGGHNVFNVNKALPLTVMPNSPDRVIDFTVDLWDSDFNSDDHLGTYTKKLNMANAWGMRENQGVMNSGKFSKINSILWAVQPQVSERGLTELQKWWGVENDPTPTLSKAQYAAAFRDVDSDPEWWDLTDWLEAAFYELVIDTLASEGNCVGMAIEAVYARKHRSQFSLPLDRFKTWPTVAGEFNVKHQYQVGAGAIWWFVDQFLDGNTHDPVDVFNKSRDAFVRGNHPVLCLAQNYNFTGAPHCILPVGWDSSAKPWKLRVCDSNWVNGKPEVREILIDPDKNTFTYVGASRYAGGEWSGGRLHYLPYGVFDERPRTPIWDAILLLLAGTIVILGSDASTESLTDENGIDLSAFGPDAVSRLQQRRPLTGKFVPFSGFDAANRGPLAAEMYLRSVPKGEFQVVSPSELDQRLSANMTIGELLRSARAKDRALLALQSSPVARRLEGMDLKSLIADAELMAGMPADASKALSRLRLASNAGKNLRHQVKGNRPGDLKYAVKSQLSQFLLTTTLSEGEPCAVHCDDIGTASSVVSCKAATDKLVRLEIENKLGVGKDRLRVVLDKIPAEVSRLMQVNVKPGLGGVEIVTGGLGAVADVSIRTSINGKVNESVFNVKLDGGVRLHPSSVLTENELKVGRVANLFGPLLGSSVVKAR